MYKKLLSALVVVAVIGGTSRTVFAIQIENPNEDAKVSICHRDSNVKQPYGPKKIEVSVNAADNSEEKSDHASHTGPVATSEEVAQNLKDVHEDWGDIIPPHDDFEGLNWTTEGQAIWNNDCQFVLVVTPPVVTPPTGGRGGGTAETITTPQVTAVPVGGVSAGAGGASGSAAPALVAMVGSALTFGYGVIRYRKFNV